MPTKSDKLKSAAMQNIEYVLLAQFAVSCARKLTSWQGLLSEGFLDHDFPLQKGNKAHVHAAVRGQSSHSEARFTRSYLSLSQPAQIRNPSQQPPYSLFLKNTDALLSQ